MSEQNPGGEPGSSRLRRLGLVVVCGLLGGLIGVIVTSVQTTRYESTARVLVGPIGGDRDTLDAAGLLTSTYADLVASRASVSRVSATLGLDLDVDDVEAVPDSRARVISITAVDDAAATAISVANALAADLIDLVATAQPGLDDGGTLVPSGSEAGQVSLLDDASEAEEAGNPAVLIVVGFALLGVVGGVLLDRLLPSIRSRADAGFVEQLGIPVVEVAHTDGPEPLGEDSWDLVAAQIAHECGAGGAYRSVAFLPADDDPEMRSLFLHLATAEARASGPVTLVDADPARAALADVFDSVAVEETPAEADRLGRPVTAVPRGVNQPVVEGSAVHFVPPPVLRDGCPARGRLQKVADELPTGAMLAVLCPPSGSAPTAIAASLAVDRLVLMVRAGRTGKQRVRDTLAALESVGTRPSAVLQIDKRYRGDDLTLRPAPRTSLAELPSGATARRPQAGSAAPGM